MQLQIADTTWRIERKRFRLLSNYFGAYFDFPWTPCTTSLRVLLLDLLTAVQLVVQQIHLTNPRLIEAGGVAAITDTVDGFPGQELVPLLRASSRDRPTDGWLLAWP